MSWTRKLLVLAATTIFAVGIAWGTAQAPDVLLLDGEKLRLNTNPLAAWLTANPNLLPRDGVTSSGNWRGYVATWEVAGGKLWLRKVEVRYSLGLDAKGRFVEEKRNVIDRLFPGRKTVVADWYSGTLIVPLGELVNYVHMGYGSTHERYRIIWVDKGDVQKSVELSAAQYTELRRERFKAFQQTERYRKELASLAEDDGPDADLAETIDFMYQFYAEEYLSTEPP